MFKVLSVVGMLAYWVILLLIFPPQSDFSRIGVGMFEVLFVVGILAYWVILLWIFPPSKCHMTCMGIENDEDT